MSDALNHSSLHHTILKYIVEEGHAPRITQLSKVFGVPEGDVRAALQALQDYHGVVLHPHDSEVWVIHPFSLAPTNFLLTKGDREWWGNCAWCSLGAAALLGGDVTITTPLGANSRQVQIRVHDGQLLDTDYHIHFPIPMTRAWDNVIYTCSTMLLFEDEATIDAWAARHNIPKGDVRPVSQVWEFAKAWYGRHLDLDWTKWTNEEARALFERHGLSGPIWDIPASAGRF